MLPIDWTRIPAQNRTSVRSFSGRSARGNHHWVVFVDNRSPVDDACAIALSQSIAPSILVLVAEAQPVPSLRFYQNRQQIHWCGSGILAAAKALLERDRLPGFVQTVQGQFRILYERNLLGFESYRRADWQASDSVYWQRVTGVSIARALQTRNSKGYALLQFPDEDSVRRWQPKLNLLRNHVSRALIITARTRPRRSCDYVMRYFAPQYGNDEDAATGSANALLMLYWAKQLNRKSLRARQLSAEGGEFFGSVRSPCRVKIFGHADILPARPPAFF